MNLPQNLETVQFTNDHLFFDSRVLSVNSLPKINDKIAEFDFSLLVKFNFFKKNSLFFKKFLIDLLENQRKKDTIYKKILKV